MPAPEKQRKLSHLLIAMAVKLLQDRVSVTSYELAEHTGWHLLTAQSLLRALHKQRCVHVVGWLKDPLGRDTTRVYAVGDGHDKPRSNLTRAEIARRYRERKKRLEKNT